MSEKFIDILKDIRDVKYPDIVEKSETSATMLEAATVAQEDMQNLNEQTVAATQDVAANKEKIRLDALVVAADKKTAESFASQAPGENVIIYTSNGDGTFSEEVTNVFSAKHWGDNYEKYTQRVSTLETAQVEGVIGFATKDDLDADLAYDENTVAIVTNDTTIENNGNYRKTGESGSGSWVQSSYDRVSYLYSDLKEFKKTIVVRDNLFNPELLIDSGYYQDADGSLSTNKNFDTQIASGLHDVEGNETYAFPTDNYFYRAHEYDAARNWLGEPTVTKTDGVGTITTKTNTRYLAVCWIDGDNEHPELASTLISSFSISNGTHILPYTSYDSAHIANEIIDNNDIIKDLQDTSVQLVKSYSRNMFNKSAASGGYLGSSSGEVSNTDISESAHSDFISVVSGNSYTISGRDVSNTRCIVFYDVDKNILPAIGDNYEDVPLNGTIIAPSDAVYVRFTLRYDSVGTFDNVQFEDGDVSTDYVAYGYKFIVDDKYINFPEVKSVAELTSHITIENSDKIAVFGNSYTEGYTMRGKHYLNNLSMFSDFQFRNFGRSGDDLLEIMDRIRKNYTWFGDVPVREWGITYGIIACRDNNGATYNINIDTYYENTKKLALEIEALGAVPILSTEHQNYDYLFNSFQRLSHERNYMFMDWGKFAYKSMDGNYFDPIFKAGHPATRTSWMWVNGMRKYLDTLPKPKQGIKLFRVRDNIDVSNSDNLLYETIYDRAKIYKELEIGNTALTADTEKYFDRLQEDTVYESTLDEYQKIQHKQSVQIGDNLLAEIIIPYTSDNVTSVDIAVNFVGVTNVYVKKTLGLTAYLPIDGTDDTYQANFENPVCEWFELEILDGTVTIPASIFKDAIVYDKFSLLFRGSAITISDISVDCTGTKLKILNKSSLCKKTNGIELLTDNLLDDGTAWEDIENVTSVAQVSSYADSNVKEHYPSGITTVREIDINTVLKQQLLEVDDDYEYKIAKVKILCRYFPEYASDDTKAANSLIKRGSYDCADLKVAIDYTYRDKLVQIAKEPVGLFWQEVVVDTIIPTHTNNLVITSADLPIQIAKVSVTLY